MPTLHSPAWNGKTPRSVRQDECVPDTSVPAHNNALHSSLLDLTAQLIPRASTKQGDGGRDSSPSRPRRSPGRLPTEGELRKKAGPGPSSSERRERWAVTRSAAIEVEKQQALEFRSASPARQSRPGRRPQLALSLSSVEAFRSSSPPGTPNQRKSQRGARSPTGASQRSATGASQRSGPRTPTTAESSRKRGAARARPETASVIRQLALAPPTPTRLATPSVPTAPTPGSSYKPPWALRAIEARRVARIEQERIEEAARVAAREKAATTMAAAHRGSESRKVARDLDKKRAEKRAAATALQSCQRRKMAGREKEQRRKNRAAERIQTVRREKLRREERKQQDAAALKLQTMQRRRGAVNARKAKVREKEGAARRLDDAAARIQAVRRGKLGRAKAEATHEQREKSAAEVALALARKKAATRLQAGARGMKARRRARQLRKANSKPLGLRWRRMGRQKPTTGAEINSRP